MPELPEVETIRLGLQKYIVGHKILDVEVKLPRLLTGDPKHIIGAKITDVSRFGKGLVIDLDNGYALAIHIKLTGQLIYKGPKEPKGTQVSKTRVGTIPNKWTHIIFKLDKNAVLYYNDLRQFGWIKIIKREDLLTLPFFKELGPEPIPSSGKPHLTLEMFKAIVAKSNVSIKPLLMDQQKIGGIGNIYANDACFDAKIDPRRKAKTLTDKEIETLFKSIHKVLEKGLKYGGATELNFVNALGQEGGYQNHFLVYSRQKEPCLVCKTPIIKIKLASRGTYFCPNCQK